MEEMHVLLRNRGKIIPTDAKSYMSVGGYVALKKALSMEGAEIIQVLKRCWFARQRRCRLSNISKTAICL